MLTMTPDAGSGTTSGERPDSFAPLTSQMMAVGDGHELYVETVGRASDYVGDNRVRKAASRSVQENISQFVQELSSANLAP